MTASKAEGPGLGCRFLNWLQPLKASGRSRRIMFSLAFELREMTAIAPASRAAAATSNRSCRDFPLMPTLGAFSASFGVRVLYWLRPANIYLCCLPVPVALVHVMPGAVWAAFALLNVAWANHPAVTAGKALGFNWHAIGAHWAKPASINLRDALVPYLLGNWPHLSSVRPTWAAPSSRSERPILRQFLYPRDSKRRHLRALLELLTGFFLFALPAGAKR